MLQGRMAKSSTVYQLHVSLDEIKPRIWRRLQVPADITLAKLHFALQDAFGWTNSHLHVFEVDDLRFGMIGADEWDDSIEDEEHVHLERVADAKSRLAYEYDFGDSWRHTIVVEKSLSVASPLKHPTCLAGKRSGPPEDVGGAHGYMDCLAAIADPKHERHDELVEWLPREFDPEHFDLDAINDALRKSRTEKLTRRARRRS